MRDAVQSVPPRRGGNGSAEQTVTIPIRGEEGSLAAIVRDLLKEDVGGKAAKPRKSKIGQAIQKEKEQDTNKIRNEYLVSYLL
jgi:hypothetical protein